MIRLATAALLLAAAACSSAPPGPGPAEPARHRTASPEAATRTLPDVELPRLDGTGRLRLSEVSGPAVVNAWATWCAPCRKELPFLGRAAREYAGITFLGVNVADPDPVAAREMVKATGATFPHVTDVRSRTRVSLGYTGGLPTTVFVDAQGRIVGEERTWFRSYSDVTAAIRRHLGVAP